MKPKNPSAARLSFTLAAAIAALLAAPSANAVTYYWDQNGTTSGFGAATGTWTNPTVSRWSTSSAGTATPGASITTTTADPLHFGTDSVALASGSITVSGTVNAASLRFGSSTTGNVTLSGGTINLADTTSIHVGAGSSTVHTITSTITGAATSLTKTGNTLRLSGNNSYTGQTLINSGTLILNNTAALGGNSPGVNGTLSVTMASGTTLQSNYAPTDLGNSDSFVYAPITLTGTGTTNFLIGAGNSASPAEAVTFNLNGAISGIAGTDVVFGNTTGDRNNANSEFVLGAASTYNGNTTIQAGFTNNRINVKAGVPDALPTTTVLTFDTVAGSGTGRLTQFDLNGNNQTLAGLDNGGVVAGSRNIVVTSSAGTPTLTINNSSDYTFGGATISGGNTTSARFAGSLALTKDGAGTFTLGGTLAGGATTNNSTYTGATNILGGTLRLSNSAAITASSGITINGSTAKLLQESTAAIAPTVTLTQGTLTGNGTVNTVNVGDATGGVISNNNGVAGAALTIGALTFNGAATVNTFNNSTSAPIVTTSLSSNAAGLVTINPTATSWPAGTYDLISYGGGSIGGAGSSQFVLGTATGATARQNPTLGVSGTAITLTVGADDVPYWVGDGDGKWNLASTNNWKLSSDNSYTTFLAGDNVLFNDSATGAGPIAVDIDVANVSPTSTTFNNPTKDYVLSGAFGISSGSLTKSGAGTLSINNTNTYTGNTTVSGGVLDVSADGAQLYNGATPVSAVVTVGSGAVLVVKNFGQGNTSGPGSTSLGNLNNAGGQIVIDGGTLRFNNETASRGRVINVGPNGATFDVVNNSTYTWTTSPGTSVPFSGSGQTLTLTGDATSTGQINLVIGGTNVSLLKNGAATWTLGGTNTYTGNTTISAGILSMAGNRIASSPTIFIGDGATLRSTGTGSFTLSANQNITGTGATGFVSLGTPGTNGFITTAGTTLSTSGVLTTARLDFRGAGNFIASGTVNAGGSATGQRGLLVGNSVAGDLTISTGATLNTVASVGNADILGNGTSGNGSLIVNGGTYNNTTGSGVLQLGNNTSNGGGTITINSGSATIGTIVYQVGGSQSGIVNLNGGTFTLGAMTSTGIGTREFNFDGGQFVAGAGVSFPADITANVKNGGAKINTNGFSATIASPMVNFGGTSVGGLTKSGPGTLTLSGTNNYAGGSSVTGGTLRFSTVAASATDVTVAGGAEAGALVAADDAQWVNTGDLNLQNNGAAIVDYGSTTPSTTTAPISVVDFTNGTTPGVRLAGSTIQNLQVGTSYPLVTWSGAGPVDGSAFSLLTHRLSGTFSVASNTLSLTVTSNATNAPISWNTGNGAWDTVSSNWLASNLTTTTYFDTLDSVLFGDASGATGNPIVTLATTVSPLGVTMNTTGRNYTISGAGSISGSGALTLPGTNSGTFTLSTANNTFSGGTTVNGGTLALGHATDTLPDTGALVLDGATAILSLGSNSDTVGAVSLKNGASITGAGTLTGSSYAFENGSASVDLAGSGNLTKSTAETVTLSGDNSYTGTTTVSEGTLVLAGANTTIGATSVSTGAKLVLANTAAVQSSSIVSLAIGTTLQLATDTAFTTLPTLGASSGASATTFVSDRATPGAGLVHGFGAPALGNNTFNFIKGTNVTSGTAGFSLEEIRMTAGSGGTTILNPTDATVSVTGPISITSGNFAKAIELSGTNVGNVISGNISNGLNVVSLSKSGTSTWTLSGTNSYTGTTTIDEGTLVFATTDQSLSGGLTFGATNGGTSVGALDLGSASATFAGAALVRTNNITPNTITIGATKSLTLNGGLTMGYDAGAGTGATNSNLTVAGAGSMAINGTTINVSVNQAATNAGYWSDPTLDVSGLANFSTDVTTFNIGVGTSTQGPGTVLLSNTANTIVATTLTAGNTGGNNGRGTGLLVLGTGSNVIQADTINIGRSKSVTGGPTGAVRFASQDPGSPGTVTIADRAGTGRANIDIANQAGTATGGGATGSLDLRGHVATVSAGTVAIGSVTAASNSGGPNGTLSFDGGSFDVNTLTMGTKSGGSTGTARGTVNVGGGTFTVNTAFTMGSQAGGGASEATVNLTGGTLTSSVSIVRGGGSVTSTINLSGGTLDLNGNAIGSGSAAITLNAESGTLKNVATINGTGGLTKTTAGTLVVEGTDPYSGNTTVTEGILTLSNAAGAGNANTLNDSSSVNIAATGATLNLAYTGTDVVNELYIGGVLQAPGVWGAVGSGAPKQDSRITGTGTLTVSTGSTGFSSWITGTFANGAVPGDKQGPNDDPDNDGIPNLVEYAIASQDPTVSNAVIGTFAANTLSFSKRQPLAGDITYAIQESTDLGNLDAWTVVTGTPPDYVNDSTTISYTLSPPAPVRNFIRLQVTQNP